MDCTDLTAILSGLLDDEVDSATRHEAERHLAECARCRTMVGRAESLDMSLRAAAHSWGRTEPLPPSLVESVLRRTVGDPQRIRLAIRRTRGLALAGWLVAAAALALAATAWFAAPFGGAEGSGRSRDALRAESSPQENPNAGSAVPAPSRPRSSPGESALVSSGDAESAPGPATGVAQGLAQGLAISDQEPSGPPTWLLAHDWNNSVAAPAMSHELDPRVAISDDPTELAEDLARDSANGLAIAMEMEDAIIDPRYREADADTLFATSLLLAQLEACDTSSFADAERVRLIIEYDGLIERLGDARERLPASLRPALWSAESLFLRLLRGPLTQDDLRQMQRDIARLGLPKALDDSSLMLSGRKPA